MKKIFTIVGTVLFIIVILAIIFDEIRGFILSPLIWFADNALGDAFGGFFGSMIQVRPTTPDEVMQLDLFHRLLSISIVIAMFLLLVGVRGLIWLNQKYQLPKNQIELRKFKVILLTYQIVNVTLILDFVVIGISVWKPTLWQNQPNLWAQILLTLFFLFGIFWRIRELKKVSFVLNSIRHKRLNYSFPPKTKIDEWTEIE